MIKRTLKHVLSPQLRNRRDVDVYLPSSYASGVRYPVVYLQDGQNMFSSAGTNIAFGWGNWQLDLTANELIRSNLMQEIIMVAVDNSRTRFVEYNGRVNSDEGVTPFENYATFLIEEVKPRIDREYRTRPDAANTGVLGSSLGGICSAVLAWEHPEVSGRAAWLSGSFQIEHTNFLNEVLHNYQGKPKPVWIYLDSGTVDFTGGDDNRALTAQVAAELQRIGLQRHQQSLDRSQPILRRVPLRRRQPPHQLLIPRTLLNQKRHRILIRRKELNQRTHPQPKRQPLQRILMPGQRAPIHKDIEPWVLALNHDVHRSCHCLKCTAQNARRKVSPERQDRLLFTSLPK